MTFGERCVLFALLATLLIGVVTQASDESKAPPTPVFARNYRVSGLLSLPYAELQEPFEAYFDKERERSRADYYEGEYKVYQFGPASAPDSASGQYGAIYKQLYVPKSFHSEASAKKWRASQLIGEAIDYATSELRLKAKTLQEDESATQDDSDDVHIRTSRTPVKRVCFAVQGGVGFTVSAQTVLPDLREFKFDSVGRCPRVAGGANRHHSCELWKYTTEVGAKKNTYKFWVRRDENGTAIPVHYYMLGFDSLLGSHYDRYDITYWNYLPGGARDPDFALDVKGHQCGPMPGPGDAADAAQRRAHLVAANPIHQYVVTPHVYDHIDHHYEQFKSQFKGTQTGPLDAQSERRSWFNFMHNLRFIHGKNRQLKEFKLAVNKFADSNVSGADLRYLRGRLHSSGFNGGLDYAQHHHHQLGTSAADKPLPEQFDWQVLGGVTPVKDQAVCGSCWSFGTVGTIEGNYFAKTGKLLRLSQQQLVDCSWQFGNNGCDGGEDFRAYAYIQQAGGLSTEEDYGHYKGIDSRCHDQDVAKPVQLAGFYNVTPNSVEALKHAIVNHGPVSISIDASRPTFTFYSHGAYFDDKCNNSPDGLDHSVLAVGYTSIDGKLVWKVKNSWSTYWGNDGYIYMLAEGNNCGVLDAPTVPIITSH